jgi:hypothetical protein
LNTEDRAFEARWQRLPTHGQSIKASAFAIGSPGLNTLGEVGRPIFLEALQRLVFSRDRFCHPVHLLRFLSNFLVQPLEQRFRRNEISNWRDLDGLIVLTGGKERLLEAAHLARQHSNLRVVVAGDTRMPSVLAQVDEGCGTSRIMLEARSSNTYENGIYSTELIRPAPTARWLLVTSAYHMPRAIGCFRRVDDLTSHGDNFFRVAVREWIALIGYRLLGRTNALLPGPVARGDERFRLGRVKT